MHPLQMQIPDLPLVLIAVLMFWSWFYLGLKPVLVQQNLQWVFVCTVILSE